jgi:hypothetical protein
MGVAIKFILCSSELRRNEVRCVGINFSEKLNSSVIRPEMYYKTRSLTKCRYQTIQIHNFSDADDDGNFDFV